LVVFVPLALQIDSFVGLLRAVVGDGGVGEGEADDEQAAVLRLHHQLLAAVVEHIAEKRGIDQQSIAIENGQKDLPIRYGFDVDRVLHPENRQDGALEAELTDLRENGQNHHRLLLLDGFL